MCLIEVAYNPLVNNRSDERNCFRWRYRDKHQEGRGAGEGGLNGRVGYASRPLSVPDLHDFLKPRFHRVDQEGHDRNKYQPYNQNR